jgi:adenylate kinase family enzyme
LRGTALSRRLGEILDVPVIHLDMYYWMPGWVASERTEWKQFLAERIEEEEWIIDGNYSGTIVMRLERADTVIFLDMPRWLCIYRIIKRRIQYHGLTRPDMNEDCPEKLHWDFIIWVWNYRKRSRGNVVRALEVAKEEKQVFILDSRKKAEIFIKRISPLKI